MRDVHTLQITPVMVRIIKQLQTVTCPAVFNLNPQPKTEQKMKQFIVGFRVSKVKMQKENH